MNSHSFGRRLGVIAGGAAIIAMGALTAACGGGGGGGESPSSTTTTTATTTSSAPASSAPASPTEKSINPTGGNLFTPPVTASPAPNVPPGQHPGIGGVS
ncbi:MAG: hypothetical protein QOF25_1195 [Mycobacterium sp.]|nr:hypothetical protein [Mycobacterium sp.]